MHNAHQLEGRRSGSIIIVGELELGSNRGRGRNALQGPKTAAAVPGSALVDFARQTVAELPQMSFYGTIVSTESMHPFVANKFAQVMEGMAGPNLQDHLGVIHELVEEYCVGIPLLGGSTNRQRIFVCICKRRGFSITMGLGGDCWRGRRR